MLCILSYVCKLGKLSTIGMIILYKVDISISHFHISPFLFTLILHCCYTIIFRLIIRLISRAPNKGLMIFTFNRLIGTILMVFMFVDLRKQLACLQLVINIWKKRIWSYFISLADFGQVTGNYYTWEQNNYSCTNLWWYRTKSWT